MIASIWSQWLLPILVFAVGLGLVIFVHELGHFLMAKWMDIKVERFALGFGPKVVGFRKGETEYCLCALPLGGYVKMLGQEDFKPTVETPEPDPRSYEAKSVGARLLVVSAGVVMNIILAAVLVVILCLVGIRFGAPVVGDTVRTLPAHTAKIEWQQAPPSMPKVTYGLKPGDRILEIDGDAVHRFAHIQIKGTFADEGDVMQFLVARQVADRRAVGVAHVGVRKGADGLYKFGIAGPRSRTLAAMSDYQTDTPLQAGDELIAIDGTPIDYGWQIEPAADALPERTPLPSRVPVTVRRGPPGAATEHRVELPVVLRLEDAYVHEGDLRRIQSIVEQRDDEGTVTRLAITHPDDSTRTVRPDEVLLDREVLLSLLGMVPRMVVRGVAADEDAPANKAGLEYGDVIVSYADEANLTFKRFLEINAERRDSATRLVVERDGQRKELEITPVSHGGSVKVGLMQGVEMSRAVVGAVLPDTPAARAGILARDRVVRVSAAPEAPADGNAATAPPGRPGESRDVESWPDLFEALRDFRDRAVTVEMDSGRRIEIDALTEAEFDPDAYAASLPGTGFRRKLMGPEVRKTNPLSAIAWGAGEVRMFALTTYATLYKWLKRDMPSDQFRGIVGIGEVAIQGARESIPHTIYLMALISAVVAVINFLPLPVVDGGLAAFLIVEKIRGKPVPTKIVNIIQMIGLGLIIFVFVALTWQDIARIFRNMW